MQNTLETKQLVSVCLNWRPVTTAGCVIYGLDLKQAWRKVISDCKQDFSHGHCCGQHVSIQERREEEEE